MSEKAAHTHCPIVHQDRFIIVVNKPAGVLSHPNSAKIDPKIRCAFEGRYDLDQKCFDGPAGKVWLIHRLDQDTSGVLLAALDARTAEKCRALFEADAVKKHYLAFIRGCPPPQDTWLDHLSITKAAGRVRTSVLKGRPRMLKCAISSSVITPVIAYRSSISPSSLGARTRSASSPPLVSILWLETTSMATSI